MSKLFNCIQSYVRCIEKKLFPIHARIEDIDYILTSSGIHQSYSFINFKYLYSILYISIILNKKKNSIDDDDVKRRKYVKCID